MINHIKVTTQPPLYEATYRMWYRCCRPAEDKTFTVDYTLAGPDDTSIMLYATYILKHYGGLKAERQSVIDLSTGKPVEQERLKGE